jgi:hypothetical protein
VGLVQPIAEAAGDQIEVAALEPQHEQSDLPHVVHRIAHPHTARERGAGLARPHGLVGDHEHRLEAGRRLDPVRRGARADGEAPVQRGGDVVRVALLLGGHAQVLSRPPCPARQRARGRYPRHDGGGARTQTAAQRHVGGDAEAIGVRVLQAGERAHAQVAPVARYLEIGLHREAAGALDLHLDVQRQGGGQDVEPGAEVGRRRGHPHAHAHRRTARSTAAMSGSQGTTLRASASAR